MPGQNISTATGYTTTHEAGVPLQTDPANIVRAFTEYHYGANYTGGAKTSGIDYHLSQKAPLADPNLTGTVDILNSSTQLILKNAADVAKAAISTNTGIVSNAATDDLSINTQGTKILLGVAGAEILRVDSAGLKLATSSTLQVTGSAAFSGSVQFTGHPTAPTQASTDNSTRVATTAYATQKANSTYLSAYQDTLTDAGLYYNIGNAIEIYQPHGNSTSVSQFGTGAITHGTLTAANVASSLTNYALKGRRLQFATGTGAAVAPAGPRSGSAAGTGATGGVAQYSAENGFLFYSRFIPQSIRPGSTSRGFFGMLGTGGTNTIVTGLSSTGTLNATLFNALGIGWDIGDSTYSWYTNDGTVNGNKTDTTIPIAISPAHPDVVDLVIFARSSSEIWMDLRVYNASSSNAAASTTVYPGDTNVPAASHLMGWILNINRDAAPASNFAMDVYKVVMRSQDIRLNNTQGIYTSGYYRFFGYDS